MHPRCHAWAAPALLAVLLAAVASARLGAQDDSPIADLRLRSSCAGRTPSSAMKRVVVYATAEITDSSALDLGPSADDFVQDVVLQLPRVLGQRPGVLPSADPGIDWLSVGRPLMVVVYRDGRIRWRMERGARDTLAAGLLGRAIDATIVDGGGFFLGADTVRDSVTFRIAWAVPSFDSSGRVRPMENKRPAIPAFSIPYPWEKQVAAKPGQPAPHYPLAARDAGYGATLIMQFVVDTAGHAIPSTIRDLWPKDRPALAGEQRRYYERFRDEVVQDIPRIEFYPAELGGCKVPQLVQMPFVFSLGR